MHNPAHCGLILKRPPVWARKQVVDKLRPATRMIIVGCQHTITSKACTGSSTGGSNQNSEPSTVPDYYLSHPDGSALGAVTQEKETQYKKRGTRVLRIGLVFTRCSERQHLREFDII